MKRRFGLRLKFTILIAGLLVTVFAAITAVLVRQTTSTLRAQLLDQSKAFAVLATKPIGDAFSTYRDSGQLKISEQIQKFTDLNKNVTNVAVIDLSGKSLFSKIQPMPVLVTASQASSFDPVFIYNSRHDLVAVVSPYVEDFGGHRFSVVYSVSSQTIERSIAQEERAILLLSLLTLVLTAGLMYLLINHFFLDPIRTLSQEAIAISGGDLSRQIAVNRRDEISDLADSVNTMANFLKADIHKLKETDELKTEFMMITSHNLRTPLTLISGYLESLSVMKIPAEVKKMLDIVAANAQRLQAFAEDILIISAIDSGQGLNLSSENIDLTNLIGGMASEFQVLADKKGVAFNFQNSAEKIEVKSNAAHLRSALWNLLDNALKFTPAKGKINLTLVRNGKFAEISVADTGIGITPEEQKKLFTKFHRGTSTLEYNYEGTGIGLYLSKLVVEQYGGSIGVQSQSGKGSVFTVKFPVKQF